MEIREALKNIGFENQEIEIYLYLVKNPSSTQQEISDHTNIVRQTIYDLVKKMETKGFVSFSIIGKRKAYSAVSPEMLLKLIQEKQEEFTQIIPKLNELFSRKKPQIYTEAFIGIQGLRNLFNLTLESKSEILWMANLRFHRNLFQDYYFQNYSLKRVEKKISSKFLTESVAGWDKSNPKQFRETKVSSFMKGEKTSFAVFDDKVIIYNIEEDRLFGVLIKNVEIKNFFEKLFYMVWNKAKKV